MPRMDLLEGKLIFVLLYGYEVLTTSTLGGLPFPLPVRQKEKRN